METRSQSLQQRFAKALAQGADNRIHIEGLSDDEVRRELVAWSTRLEFESMDLRERSKTLSFQLMANSNALESATSSVTESLEKFTCLTKEPVEQLVSSLKKVNDSIKLTSSQLTKQRKELQQDVVGEGYLTTVQMLRSISSQLDRLSGSRFPSQFFGNVNNTGRDDKELKDIVTNLDHLVAYQATKFDQSMEIILNKLSNLERTMAANSLEDNRFGPVISRIELNSRDSQSVSLPMTPARSRRSSRQNLDPEDDDLGVTAPSTPDDFPNQTRTRSMTRRMTAQAFKTPSKKSLTQLNCKRPSTSNTNLRNTPRVKKVIHPRKLFLSQADTPSLLSDVEDDP